MLRPGLQLSPSVPLQKHIDITPSCVFADFLIKGSFNLLHSDDLTLFRFAGELVEYFLFFFITVMK